MRGRYLISSIVSFHSGLLLAARGAMLPGYHAARSHRDWCWTSQLLRPYLGVSSALNTRLLAGLTVVFPHGHSAI